MLHPTPWPGLRSSSCSTHARLRGWRPCHSPCRSPSGTDTRESPVPVRPPPRCRALRRRPACPTLTPPCGEACVLRLCAPPEEKPVPAREVSTCALQLRSRAPSCQDTRSVHGKSVLLSSGGNDAALGCYSAVCFHRMGRHGCVRRGRPSAVIYELQGHSVKASTLKHRGEQTKTKQKPKHITFSLGPELWPLRSWPRSPGTWELQWPLSRPTASPPRRAKVVPECVPTQPLLPRGPRVIILNKYLS